MEKASASAQPQPVAGSAISPPAPESPVAPRQPQAAAAPDATGLHALESEITFNVLDHVEIDRASGKIILMGHNDAAYATKRIPYLQYLATLSDNPDPEFSLEWTAASEARVAELRRRLNSDDEWKRLAGEWGRWIDDSENLTAAGRFFMPLFGIALPSGSKMDRYQVLAGVFRAVGEREAADILAAFGEMHRAMPNLTTQQLYRLFRVGGVFEQFVELRSQLQAGRMTAEQVKTRVYRALFANFDRAMKYSGNPTASALESALRRGRSADDAMGAASEEFDRQIEGAYGAALRRLYRSKAEIDVPITLVNPAWKDALNVEPKYIGVKSSSLLAKLLLDADRTAKALVNMPELASKISGYQTQFAYRLKRGTVRRSNRVSSERLWISVERIEASRSNDGNILAFAEAKMRFNIRELQGGQDRPGQQPGEYENLLTSLYDGFARHYSPVFHELREAAKLAYAAQWLKAKNAPLRVPAAALETWQSPASVPGVIFITWSADPSRPDVQSVSAIGGVSLRVPPPGRGVCVKFCEEQIPRDDRIRPISALSTSVITDLALSATQAIQSLGNVGLYLSKVQNPLEAYASASTVPAPNPPPSPPTKSANDSCTLSPDARSLYEKLTEEQQKQFDPGSYPCGELKTGERENLGALICVLEELKTVNGLPLQKHEKLMAAWWASIESFLEAPPQGFAVCRENQGEKQHRAPGSNCDAGFYSGGWQVGYGNQVFDGVRDLETIFKNIYGDGKHPEDKRPEDVANSVLEKARAQLKGPGSLANLSLRFPKGEEWPWAQLRWDWSREKQEEREKGNAGEAVRRRAGQIAKSLMQDPAVQRRIEQELEQFVNALRVRKTNIDEKKVQEERTKKQKELNDDLKSEANQQASTEFRKHVQNYSGRDLYFWASILMRDPKISAYLVVQNDVRYFNCYGSKPADWCTKNGYTNPDRRARDARKMLTMIQAWPDLEKRCGLK